MHTKEHRIAERIATEGDRIDRSIVSLMVLKQHLPAEARYRVDINYQREKIRLAGLLSELLEDDDLNAVAETAQEEVERAGGRLK